MEHWDPWKCHQPEQLSCLGWPSSLWRRHKTDVNKYSSAKGDDLILMSFILIDTAVEQDMFRVYSSSSLMSAGIDSSPSVPCEHVQGRGLQEIDDVEQDIDS